MTTGQDTRARLAAVSVMTPEERWAPFARQIHPSLIRGHHWLPLADAIDQADRHGVDVHTALPVLAAQKPLDPGRAAADLKYRLLAATDFPLAAGPAVRTDQLNGPSTPAARRPLTPAPRPDTSPRI